MVFVNTFNKNRLKSARIFSGFTISDLAEQSGVSKQAISQFENGKNKPTLETLMKLMYVLKLPREYFYEADSIEEVQVGNTFFRSLVSTSKKERLSQIEKTRYFSRICDFLERYIDFPTVNLPSIKDLIELTDKKVDNPHLLEREDIEDIALALRKYWGIGEDPITNIVFLLEKNGVVMTSLATDTHKIDAFSQRQMINNRERYVIILGDGKQSACRRQFDTAHELGHMLLHNWNTDFNDIYLEEHRLIEQQADSFAGAFLLPKDSFLKDLHYPNNLNFYIELKKKWKVSIQAMIVRAFHLDAINYNQYTYLMKKMNQKNMRKKEPLDDVLNVPQPMLIRKAVEMLLKANVLKPRDIIEADGLMLTQEIVEYLLNLEKGTLSEEKKDNVEVLLQFRSSNNYT
ncbi:Zn-dependent peptidase ImmA (M78 family) [Aneurinibacillus soli]|uniref:DNA-binding transcriptional repressor PuuR n=1 Tax=Aneurinibacillus soli TaxID=1500254 RepID=A0A0U5BHF6_9BACL|nr:XRE family transcriptional regulator [Aneurinibacillus soli]PYE61903.1 Zn-dependent peptidase ImmA (M78 family) [Aneurinibacillus soli]BAU29719.1 DNA-binding transcriptional repressor PuuR [Aneurinibacillus soli]